MQLLKREIEAEITSLDNRKKLKKSGQNEKEKEKEKRREKRKKAPITQTKLNFKLCSVDYKAEKGKRSQLLQDIQHKYQQTIKRPSFGSYQIIFGKCH